jgi:hypothetical protein
MIPRGADRGSLVVVGGKVIVGIEVVAVVEEPTAVVVAKCPPNVTRAVIPNAATIAIAATMIIVRLRSIDPLLARHPACFK